MVVTMISSSMVRPAKPTTPNAHICISDCDQDKSITHAPVIYFYRPSSDPNLFSFPLASQTLKDALSQVLVHFYPLLGRLHFTDDGGRVGLKFNSEDDGVLFYEAESDATIEDFKDFAPTKELRSLIPSVDYANVALDQQPLMLVQLTRFSCGGISLGTAISHIMLDGTTASHFISEWARIARGESLQDPPFLDRSILLGSCTSSTTTLSPYNNIRYDPYPLLMGKQNDDEERSKETTVTMLQLSVANLNKLKEVANKNRASNIRAYSRYEVVAGHIWRCSCKARENSPDQPTKAAVQVSIRKCMSLPKWYFGNAFYRTYTSSTSGELITMPLAYATSKIREAIDRVTEDNVKLTLDLSKVQPDINQWRTSHVVGSSQGCFMGNPNMEITSWLGIPLSGADFGWGKEIYMGPGSVNSDGKCFILPGRSEVGSVTIAMRLQTAHIHRFTKIFYQDI